MNITKKSKVCVEIHVVEKTKTQFCVSQSATLYTPYPGQLQWLLPIVQNMTSQYYTVKVYYWESLEDSAISGFPRPDLFPEAKARETGLVTGNQNLVYSQNGILLLLYHTKSNILKTLRHTMYRVQAHKTQKQHCDIASSGKTSSAEMIMSWRHSIFGAMIVSGVAWDKEYTMALIGWYGIGC